MVSQHQVTFNAMNTQVELTFCSVDEAAAGTEAFAKNWFRYVEDRFSRFIPQSELSQLNRLAGDCCLVSETMLEVVQLAEMYRQLTNGIFDPLLLNSLLNAGYTESFEQLITANNIKTHRAANSNQRHSIIIDNGMKSIQLPEQVTMDLGGIVKSWAVQRLANHFQKKLLIDKGIINAGGDLTCWNHSSTANELPWVIGIENPWQANEELGQLVMSNGSIATSSKLGRQWQNELGSMHHIIDPRTMLPSDNEVVQCMVMGKNVIDCEIWAKVICIVGCSEGIELLNAKTEDYEAIIFTAQQETHYYGEKALLDSHWLELEIDHYHVGGC
ncbi:FAD:protein FMN transferase [Paenibacillus psychroresistens]|uniref:FAD:protein FMN transferase n=1 Tax=Paenibacillus psychroresistens TaxID=1778678 RepID=A0A6B8RMD2_9BACL|nr:FAD:protein FMN transferase [Paenibacillus psychroresistens]QGQ97179.1 FAD:protein FMN transferase [Paenibacillus psychroresistens]